MKFCQRFGLIVRFPFQPAAFGDVPNVALNDLAMIDLIDVADKFNFDLLPGFGFEWQILVADIAFVLQFSESRFVFLGISEHTELPKFLADHLDLRIPQHVLDEGISIEDLTVSFIEDEDGVLCRFKESPIAEFRILQCYFRAPASVIPRWRAGSASVRNQQTRSDWH